MGVRILIFVVVLAVILQYLHAAPNPNAKPMDLDSREQKQLIDSFVQFLRTDSQIYGYGDNHLGALSRNKRESGRAAENPDDIEEGSKPGFFDKAAKFVTELLQRFLKWINSSDDN